MAEVRECPNRKRNKETCPCPYTDCSRHGICCECMRYHLSKGQKPACMR